MGWLRWFSQFTDGCYIFFQARTLHSRSVTPMLRGFCFLRQVAPRIVVQSASIEDGINQRQQPVRFATVEYLLVGTDCNLGGLALFLKVLAEEASPGFQSPRVPLPPPIIPETEDSTSSPVSETSSGYVSNSISTATLSDVYTLSWDLPPLAGRRSDGFEALPDTEEESSVSHLQPLCQESLLVWDEGAGTVPSGPDGASPDTHPRQQEAPPATEHKPDSEANQAGAEQESLDQEDQRGQLETPPEAEKGPQIQGAGLHTPEETEQPPLQSETLDAIPQTQPRREQAPFQGPPDPTPRQVPEDPQLLIPTPASSGEQVYLDVAEIQPTPELPNSNCIPTSPPAHNEAPADASNASAAPDLAQSSAEPSKPHPSGANPFTIQKVKSSDLKSFQPILGTAEFAGPQVDHTNSLAVPLESLEIISDSEEGDAAAAVLPDWLKEEEFVTVGGNKSGTVRYVGPADFAKGTWVGVELEVPAGG